MSNLTSGTRPQPYGRDGRNVVLPQAANAQIWEGALVAPSSGTDGALVTGTTAGSGHCVGVATFDQLGGATDGAVRMQIWTDAVVIVNAGVNAPTDLTPFGTPLFMETDNTVGTGAGGETQIGGRFYGIEDDGRVRLYVSSQASWNDANANTNDGGTAAFKVRAVITTLQAYGGTTTGVLTETANGAISAADGVTLALGDVVFVQEGTTNLTTASDAGPYVVTALGGASAKWQLTRPSWWQTGAAMALGQTLDVGGEGTLWAGSSWRSFAAKGSVVDTTAPLFWVRSITQEVTLTGSGNKAISNVGIRSATQSQVLVSKVTNGGTISSTVRYEMTPASSPGAITAGALGTGAVTVQASVAAGTANASDQSVVNVTIINW